MAKPKTTEPARTGETVTVALKSPHGIILQLHDQVEVSVPVMGGGMRMETQFRPSADLGATFRLNGNAVPFGESPKHTIVGGFALTHGVPKDFWEAWLKQNPRLGIVTSNLIHAYDTVDAAAGEARDKRAVRSGLEPLNMSKNSGDPRIPKRKDMESGKVVDAVETSHAA